MIGLGGGSLAKDYELKLPTADFTAVEISPELIALVRNARRTAR
jgi:spermidine synthase